MRFRVDVVSFCCRSVEVVVSRTSSCGSRWPRRAVVRRVVAAVAVDRRRAAVLLAEENA